MRDNVRNVRNHRAGRERWEFALDNRQIAAVAVGALVIVGSAFVLGMNAGSMSARKAATATASNSLDAFNVAHENLPAPPEPKSWEYEKLGAGRSGDAAAAQARVPPSPRPLTPRPTDSGATASATAAAAASPAAVSASAAPTASATPAPAATSAPAAVATNHDAKPSTPPPAPAPAAATPPSAMEKAVAAVSGRAQAPEATPARAAATPAAKGGAYVIQIGASTNRVEADRIANRYASRGARVVTADVEGKRWYRVRLASTTYRDRPEAERALTRLSRETGVRGFVTAAQ